MSFQLDHFRLALHQSHPNFGVNDFLAFKNCAKLRATQFDLIFLCDANVVSCSIFFAHNTATERVNIQQSVQNEISYRENHRNRESRQYAVINQTMFGTLIHTLIIDSSVFSAQFPYQDCCALQ